MDSESILVIKALDTTIRAGKTDVHVEYRPLTTAQRASCVVATIVMIVGFSWWNGDERCYANFVSN